MSDELELLNSSLFNGSELSTLAKLQMRLVVTSQVCHQSSMSSTSSVIGSCKQIIVDNEVTVIGLYHLKRGHTLLCHCVVKQRNLAKEMGAWYRNVTCNVDCV